ncbi:hypothetical protein [Subtercola frigoramans]|uniref:Uncharacterized protein n=1 Tax=Subtercola frigoramans TaxID=120298 RepID=A0ABS2L0G0_9MICO|nr:hypothetical protein [Subtercola frigoramans]MBM7470549.1 hypothetical protein [Subtercola frigoramans]
MQTYTASGRSRWPWIIGGAVILIAVIVAIIYGTSHGTTTTADPTTTASPSASPSATATTQPTQGGSDGNDDAAPTGCLGGANRDADMVLAAQKAAPHTTSGAVEVAAAFFRWAIRYPYPATDEADAMSATIMSANAPASFKDIAGAYAHGNDISGGQVPEGTDFYLSTVPGRWLVESSSTSDQITVDVSAAFVVADALSPTKSASEAFIMVWEDGGWKVDREQQADTAALAAGGTLFTAGC